MCSARKLPKSFAQAHSCFLPSRNNIASLSSPLLLERGTFNRYNFPVSEAVTLTFGRLNFILVAVRPANNRKKPIFISISELRCLTVLDLEGENRRPFLIIWLEASWWMCSYFRLSRVCGMQDAIKLHRLLSKLLFTHSMKISVILMSDIILRKRGDNDYFSIIYLVCPHIPTTIWWVFWSFVMTNLS